MMRELVRYQFVVIVLIGIAGCKYYPGQRPRPFRTSGVWYEVKAGDTIEKIASRYKAKTELVAEINDLSGDSALQKREEIFVPTRGGAHPGGGKPRPQRTAAKRPKVSAAVSTTKYRENKTEKNPNDVTGRCDNRTQPCLAWPVKGLVVTGYGTGAGRHHDGIDVATKQNAPVMAAAKGDVLYSGNEIKGYGNLIIIRHENQLITVYAHNERNLVKEGDKVKRSEPIALAGQTGIATAPHLHFEVRVGDDPQDPLRYLEARE